MTTKVTVYGAGNVGATAVQRVVEKGLGDVMLIDIVEGMPQGKALDMMQAGSIEGYAHTVTGSNDINDVAGSDLVIITAGLARKPGMSRSDLLAKNAAIVGGIASAIKEHAPNATVIVVTNPLDIMTYLVQKVTGFGKQRVFGMAGVLDTSRMRAFIGMELSIPGKDVECMVLGGHGDTMVPLKSSIQVNGQPLGDRISADRLAAIVERTQKGGGEIVALLKTGSAYYAPSAAVVEMAQSVLRNEKKVLPGCALLEGEYGYNGIFLGVPIRLGKDGMEGIVQMDLTDEEKAMLDNSANAVKEDIAILEDILAKQ